MSQHSASRRRPVSTQTAVPPPADICVSMYEEGQGQPANPFKGTTLLYCSCLGGRSSDQGLPRGPQPGHCTWASPLYRGMASPCPGPECMLGYKWGPLTKNSQRATRRGSQFTEPKVKKTKPKSNHDRGSFKFHFQINENPGPPRHTHRGEQSPDPRSTHAQTRPSQGRAGQVRGPLTPQAPSKHALNSHSE